VSANQKCLKNLIFSFRRCALSLLSAFSVIACVSLLAACGGSNASTTPPTLNSISVAPSSTSVNVAGTKQFSATGHYSDGTTQDLTATASWSSSNKSNATVETSGQATPGLATGVASGSVTISASTSAITGSASLSVSGGTATLQSITVTPSNPSVTVGNSVAFTATGNYSDGSTKNLTATSAWTTSNADATIETSGQAQPGLAKGASVGSVTITAANSGISGNAMLMVNANTSALQSISVSPLSPSVAIGVTQQFDATGTYTDGTTQDITASVAWKSSNTADATIQTKGQAQPGLATGVLAGSVTITASSGTINGTASLTITSGAGNTTPIPLMDMTPSDNYLNFSGGLYENSSDTVPSDHDADGKSFAAQIQPLDTNGNPSASGMIVFVSFGMSNAQIEFNSFVTITQGNSQVNHSTLHISNGASSEQDACYWFPAEGAPSCNSQFENEYDRISGDLSSSGLSANQVQVAWIDNANGRVHPENRGCVPFGTLCNPLCDPTTTGCVNNENTTNAFNEEEEFGETLRAAKTRFPNLKLIFFSSRVYGGYANSDAADPEPFAYETGYGIKWLIQAQINQVATGAVDPVAGDLSYANAPWIAWSAYFWADGDTPRSDGLVWCNGQTGPPCNGEQDFGSDGLHLTATGGDKAANLLLNYLLTSPYTKSWFAASP
jgi:uncharacterized protein YjdB